MVLEKDYPYMYARVSAKKKKLLERNDYEGLWKMQPNGIARKLEEGDYKEDINELGSEHAGVELVELALMRNLSRTMAHLAEISPDSLKPVINAYLRRYDILSFKRLLRWKKGGEENSIDSFLMPVGDYSFEDFKELSEQSFEEICGSIKFPDTDVDYCGSIDPDMDIREIERELDRQYYKELEEISDTVGSVWFDRFVNQELEYENLKIALRLKKYGVEQDEIREWLVTDEFTDTLEQIIEAEDLEEAVEVVRDSGKAEDISGDQTLEEVEHSLEVARLNRALRNLHIEPLGATSILGYIIAKITEVKNLRMLIRAKETGIQNIETIKRNLVIT
jgi:V/A-type H+-transporting ATPase subunit C